VIRGAPDPFSSVFPVIADLDELPGYPPIVEQSVCKSERAEVRRVRHQRRLGEPYRRPTRLCVQEERAALWDALGFPASQAKEMSPWWMNRDTGF
jgi:hypothetical protein